MPLLRGRKGLSICHDVMGGLSLTSQSSSGLFVTSGVECCKLGQGREAGGLRDSQRWVLYKLQSQGKRFFVPGVAFCSLSWQDINSFFLKCQLNDQLKIRIMQCATSTDLKVTHIQVKKKILLYQTLWNCRGQNILASKRKVDIFMALMSLCTGSYN